MSTRPTGTPPTGTAPPRSRSSPTARSSSPASSTLPPTSSSRAWTTPELVRRWWGFETSEWLVCEIDLREGGTWRYVTRETVDAEPFEVGFHGEFRTIDAPHRIVSTEVYEGFSDPEAPGDEAGAVNTITFDESDGVTTMTVLVSARQAGVPRRPHRLRHGGRHADLDEPARGPGDRAGPHRIGARTRAVHERGPNRAASRGSPRASHAAGGPPWCASDRCGSR